jgi:hypothetical protein
MPEPPGLAFAKGLRKNVAVAAARWAAWPGGSVAHARVIATIDDIIARLPSEEAAGIADLRTLLEWTTYQAASIKTARAIIAARKTRRFAEAFGLEEDRVSGLAVLAASESALLDNVRATTSYMRALADRAPHLALPRPLVSAEALATRPAPRPGRLALIQALRKADPATPATSPSPSSRRPSRDES